MATVGHGRLSVGHNRLRAFDRPTVLADRFSDRFSDRLTDRLTDHFFLFNEFNQDKTLKSVFVSEFNQKKNAI